MHVVNNESFLFILKMLLLIKIFFSYDRFFDLKRLFFHFLFLMYTELWTCIVLTISIIAFVFYLVVWWWWNATSFCDLCKSLILTIFLCIFFIVLTMRLWLKAFYRKYHNFVLLTRLFLNNMSLSVICSYILDWDMHLLLNSMRLFRLVLICLNQISWELIC